MTSLRSQSMLPTISVVVPTFRRAAQLPAVVERLLAEPAHEIVVVVDGCRDGSIEYLEDRAASDSRLRPVFTENGGEGRARQRGAEHATGDIALFLDDDVLAHPGLVAGHARHHASSDGATRIVLGYMPTITEPVRRRQDVATYLYRDEYERRCQLYEQDPDSILQRLWAGNFSMARERALEVGLASDAYTERYHPDREFGLRCRKHGLQAVFDRSLRADHLYRRTPQEFRRDARSQGAGRRRLAHLHAGAVDAAGEEQFLEGLPVPLRAVVVGARRPRSYAIASEGLLSLVTVAGTLRAHRTQVAAARLLRRVEQLRGWRVGSAR